MLSVKAHPHSLVRIAVKQKEDHYQVQVGERCVAEPTTWNEAMAEANKIANRWRANSAGWKW